MSQPLTRILIVVLSPVLVGFGTFLLMQSLVFAPADPSNQVRVPIEISPGMTFPQITSLLEQKGIIRTAKSLAWRARLRGESPKITLGEYELSPSMPPDEVLEILTTGKVVLREISVTPGMSSWEIGPLLEKKGLLSQAEFEAAVTNPSLLVRAGISAQSFEGYLYPHTYQFSRPITAEHVIWAMIEEGEKHWPNEFTDRANVLNFSRHDMITLSSIIEKEAYNEEEKAKISSVLHNRYNESMKLRSEATVIYGLTDYDGMLTKDQLDNPHPYNTFVHYGLPLGPICNPGENSVRAALNPEQTPFLFFAQDGKGGHTFHTTEAEYKEALKALNLGY